MIIRRIILGTLLMLSVFLFSCNEDLAIKEKDLHKTPWLIPFIPSSIKKFEGTHDIDRGILKFSFSESHQVNTLSKYDTVASKEKWKVIAKTQLTREYSKANSVGYYEKDQNVIKIQLDTTNGRINFLVD